MNNMHRSMYFLGPLLGSLALFSSGCSTSQYGYGTPRLSHYETFYEGSTRTQHARQLVTSAMVIQLPEGKWTLMAKEVYEMTKPAGPSFRSAAGVLGKFKKNELGGSEVLALAIFDAFSVSSTLDSHLYRGCPEAPPDRSQVIVDFPRQAGVAGCLMAGMVLMAGDAGRELMAGITADTMHPKIAQLAGDKRGPSLSRQTSEYLSARGARIPNSMFSVTFFGVSDSQTLAVHFMFNPYLDGIERSRTSDLLRDWNPQRLAPERKRYVDRLIRWAQEWQPKYLMSFESLSRGR
jgi:hypothetical protein